ncbi:hypothetical protein HNQ36_005338, partial [Afipia massiliensis]|nr:hypothetical protein [Afipia massiliensis]
MRSTAKAGISSAPLRDCDGLVFFPLRGWCRCAKPAYRDRTAA